MNSPCFNFVYHYTFCNDALNFNFLKLTNFEKKSIKSFFLKYLYKVTKWQLNQQVFWRIETISLHKLKP